MLWFEWEHQDIANPFTCLTFCFSVSISPLSLSLSLSLFSLSLSLSLSLSVRHTHTDWWSLNCSRRGLSGLWNQRYLFISFWHLLTGIFSCRAFVRAAGRATVNHLQFVAITIKVWHCLADFWNCGFRGSRMARGNNPRVHVQQHSELSGAWTPLCQACFDVFLVATAVICCLFCLFVVASLGR